MKRLLTGVLLVSGLASLKAEQQTPRLLALTVVPNVVYVSSASDCRIQLRVPDPGAITGKISVERVDADGKRIRTIGELRDHGTFDSIDAEPHLQIMKTTFNEPKPGWIYIRARAAFADDKNPAYTKIERVRIMPRDMPINPMPSNLSKVSHSPAHGDFVDNELLVSFKNEIPIERIQAILNKAGVRIGGYMNMGAMEFFHVRTPEGKTIETMTRLQKYPEIKNVSVNGIARTVE